MALQVFAGFDQMLGGAGDFIIYILVKNLQVRMRAVQQADAHGDGAHIQVHFADHLVGFLHFHQGDHRSPPKLEC
ncbi:hypothetical protein D3C71_1999950 [compost metagenome]